MFGQEFNLYGYRLSTEELKAMGFIINHKKAYRLMKDNGLLLERVLPGRMPRQWVKWRTVKDAKLLEHQCMDIKYVYIHGAKRNAYLLAIIDVATPEENSYIESLLSMVDKEVIWRYEFDSLYHAREVFQRHALGSVSPEEYWNTVFHCHPVKPPAAQIRIVGYLC